MMDINYISVEEINKRLETPTVFVNEAETLYNDRLVEAVNKIYNERFEKPIVLLSGPSGAGKTTTAFRIAKMLECRGIVVHTISMDNYFLPNDFENLPRDENDEIDLESPHRLDIPLFTAHLEKFLCGEPVMIPLFHFMTQTRTVKETIKRKSNEIIIFEGIHALNPLVTGKVIDRTNRIYVSVRTRISSDNAVLHPYTIRLMRRLNRDRLFRGRNVSEIFGMLRSVRRGENLYILPFKDSASINIDTFIEYEASVYKSLLLPELEASFDVLSDNEEYRTLMEIMRSVDGISMEYVPDNSLVREFVGGSTFQY